jgi:L-asparaginase
VRLEESARRARVAVVFTGGTISMRFDARAQGAVPSLSADDILAATRGIEDVADVASEQWGSFPGPHMTTERMWALRERLRALLADASIDGVVVTHGTDTLEESAYLCARSLPREKPLVFTGAMRAASDLGWDGPANLLDAARVAASPEARGYGALVVMNGRIFSASDETKAHTHLLDAFESPGLGPVGILDEDEVIFRRALSPQPPVIDPPALATPVDIVSAWAGADSRLLDASRADGKGVVLAALGRGNVPPDMVPGVERWIADGKPVVVSSRAQRGRVGDTYAYYGGGRTLQQMGAIFSGSRRPQQARIDLMLALGAGMDPDRIRAMFEG